jgi:hypothetical protein
MYCERANVAGVVRAAGGSEQLLVLSHRYEGRSCYRVFWGLFDSRQDALAGLSTVPQTIRAPESSPVPVSALIP